MPLKQKISFRSRKFFKFIVFITILSIIFFIFTYLIQLNNDSHKDEFLTIFKSRNIDDINDGQLVNYTNFKYHIKSKLCNDFHGDFLGVIIVTSYVGHDETRAAHRQAISTVKLREMGLIRVFLLAEIPTKEKFITQKQIEDENRKFGDIIQGNFLEAYRNLTYKHVMGLKWSVLECNRAKFIVKIDDDIVFDVFYLKNYLENLELHGSKRNFLAGYILDNKKPIRISVNKWFVSKNEFDGDLYPDYLSGWLYITNPDTAAKLILESQQMKFFWIDDTFITGIVRDRLGIELIRLNKWFSANSEFLDCCLKDLKDFSYECEYYVGPNGGDTKLITEFVHEVEKCYFDECNKRSSEKSLKQTCVAQAKHLIEDHGEALIRAIRLR